MLSNIPSPKINRP